jgi:hypothetical protein
VFLPILSIYISPIPGVELGTFAVLLFTPYLVMKGGKMKFHFPTAMGLVLIYTILCTVIALMGDEFYSPPSSIILRLGRFVVLLSILIGLGVPSFYKQERYIKLLSNVTVIVAVYAIIQYVASHLYELNLPNTFGPVKQEGVIYEAINFEYRPSSFLPEPSSATYFMVPYLCYSLFSVESKRDKWCFQKALLISLGILCTTSGQGLLILIVCWSIWIILAIWKSTSLSLKRLVIFLLFGLIALSQIDLNFTIDRITTEDRMNAIDARSEGYDLIKTIPIGELIYGKGFGNYDEEVFFSSFASIIFCTGIINLILVVIMYFHFFVKGDLFSKMLVICSLVLMSGGGVYTATYICFYYPLLISNTKRNSIKLRRKVVL